MGRTAAAEEPGTRLGTRDRAGVGLLLRAVRAAPGRVRRMVVLLRPDCAGLLSARVHASRIPPEHPEPSSVRLHAYWLLAGDVPAQHPAAQARPAAQPVPAGPASVPPAGEPVDDGRDHA